MIRGRLLGVDYGTVRIGLALSDPDQIIASPFAVYQRRDESRDADYFISLVEQECVAGLVVGLPVHLDNFEGEQALTVRRFGEWLSLVTQRPVDYCDERYTSVEAEAILRAARLTHKKRKALRDALAAQQILAAYLQSHAASK